MDPSKVLQKAYLADVDDGTNLQFMYIPQEIQEQKSVNWNPTSIIGRSESLIGYGSSENSTLTMELQFIVSKIDGDTSSKSDFALYDEMMNKIRWLRSFAYPDYGTSTAMAFTKPPHKAYLCVGKLIKSFVLIQSVDVTYRGPWNADLLPTIVVVSMPMTIINPTALGIYQIRAGLDRY